MRAMIMTPIFENLMLYSDCTSLVPSCLNPHSSSLIHSWGNGGLESFSVSLLRGSHQEQLISFRKEVVR